MHCCRVQWMVLLAVLISILYPYMVCESIQVKGGPTVAVAQDEVINDDLFAAAGDITIDGLIKGDLIACARYITVNRQVAEDAWLAAETVKISGTIEEDLRAAGREVNVSGSVRDSVMLAGQTVEIGKSGKIGGDCYLAGEKVEVSGTLYKNLKVVGKIVRLKGVVAGDCWIEVDELIIGPQALIKGNLTYRSTKEAEIARGAKILGTVSWSKVTAKPEAPKRVSPWGRIFWGTIFFFAFLAVGAISIAVAPQGTAQVARSLRSAPLWSLLWGFIILVCVPIACIILMITLVGLPLSFICLSLYVIMIYLSRIFSGLALGQLILKTGVKESKGVLFLSLTLGALIICLLAQIPIIGWLVNLVAIICGLGAFIVSCQRLLRERREKEELPSKPL